ncbi:MAG: phosphate ABC transporter permease PstA, partial [Gammaproteobacteria bacterium]
MTKNALASAFIWLTAALVSGGFLWLLADIILHGLPKLSWPFFVEAPQNAGRSGGIGPIIVSTGLILL